MAGQKHFKELDKHPEHKKSGSSNGQNGRCLIRHDASTPEKGKKNSCAYRWQAYLQMKGDAGIYNWPKYKSLTAKSKIRTAGVGSAAKTFPRWYSLELDAPKEGEWDVKGDNFFKKCYLPYWHEAHHIVPNGTLKNAILQFAKPDDVPNEVVPMIIDGLLKEKYNLNYKNNMIMLPLDQEVADAIGLPRHRQTALHWHHAAYSNHVLVQLGKIFTELKQDLVKHDEPAYQSLKRKIEALSESLYSQIKSCKAAALDSMPEETL